MRGVCQLPLASQSMDLVVMPHVLEFSKDPHQILREAERVLMPEGQIIIAGFNPLTGNLGVSYIRNKITVRVQATYRGRYLATYNVNESRMVYFRERTRLDIRSLYQFSRRLGFYLDATNLLPIEGGDNRDTGGRPSNYGWSSPLFSFGANMRL